MDLVGLLALRSGGRFTRWIWTIVAGLTSYPYSLHVWTVFFAVFYISARVFLIAESCMQIPRFPTAVYGVPA